MAEVESTIEALNRPMTAMTLEASALEYSILTLDTNPLRIVQLVSDDDWEYSDTENGVYVPVPANTGYNIRIVHQETSFWAKGAGDLVPTTIG